MKLNTFIIDPQLVTPMFPFYSIIVIIEVERKVILVSVLETGLPGIAQTAGSDHHFSICCPNSD